MKKHVLNDLGKYALNDLVLISIISILLVSAIAIAQTDSLNIAKQWMARLEGEQERVQAVRNLVTAGDTLNVRVSGQVFKIKLTTAQKTAYKAFLKKATDSYEVVRDSTVKYLPRSKYGVTKEYFGDVQITDQTIFGPVVIK